SRRRHTRSDRDWSSDVCSSDLLYPMREQLAHRVQAVLHRHVLLAGVLELGGGAHELERLRLVARALRQPGLRAQDLDLDLPAPRSEERRVGKGWRSEVEP